MKKLFYFLIFALCVTMFSCAKDEVVTPNEQSPEIVAPDENNCSVYESPATDFKYEIVIDNMKPHVAITKYIGKSKKVVVPAKIDGVPVTSFRTVYEEDGTESTGVFEGSNVETVVLGENIKTVGDKTFKDCKELKSITFNKSTKTVGFKAFENCTALESVDFSDTQLFRIDYYAFRGCTALREVKLSDCIEEICREAFYNCTAIEEMHFPESLTKIENGAFYYCTSLKKINIPTNLKLLADESVMFCYTALESVEFDYGRTSIDGYALLFTEVNHGNLEIIIPETVTSFSFDPFLLLNHTKFIFLGDCPESTDTLNNDELNITIFYDSNTNGWDNCPWKDRYPLIPIE